MELSFRKCVFVLMWLLFQSVNSAPSSTPLRQFNTFLYDLNFQCPVVIPSTNSPIQVNGDSFEKAVNSIRKDEYTAVLFYASWCPFSSILQAKFATLSSLYPQIEHLMVEQSSAMPSIFSRYGIHSVPSLLLLNQTTRLRYYGDKDIHSLVNFYRQSTGMNPVIDIVGETSSDSESDLKFFTLWSGGSFKEKFSREPYLVFAVIFVLLRAFLHFSPEITSRLGALWLAYVPHLNLGILGESRQLLDRLLHLIDVKRIWSKLKLCKTRNFHEGARSARVWASSLASVSLGETSASRVFTSTDL